MTMSGETSEPYQALGEVLAAPQDALSGVEAGPVDPVIVDEDQTRKYMGMSTLALLSLRNPNGTNIIVQPPAGFLGACHPRG